MRDAVSLQQFYLVLNRKRPPAGNRLVALEWHWRFRGIDGADQEKTVRERPERLQFLAADRKENAVAAAFQQGDGIRPIRDLEP